MDLARGSVTIGVEPNDGFGAEQACCRDGGISVAPEDIEDFERPRDNGTVVGGVTFLPPRCCLGKSCVDADLGSVFGDVLGCKGVISGPN